MAAFGTSCPSPVSATLISLVASAVDRYTALNAYGAASAAGGRAMSAATMPSDHALTAGEATARARSIVSPGHAAVHHLVQFSTKRVDLLLAQGGRVALEEQGIGQRHVQVGRASLKQLVPVRLVHVVSLNLQQNLGVDV